MPLDVDLPRAVLDDGALPLFLRVAGQILTDITDVGARPGDRLPSERTLAERYAISRDTLRAALAELQRRGLVVARPTRGWEISASARPDTRLDRHVPGFAEYAAASGLTTHTRVQSAAVRPATLPESDTLRVAPGTPIFELRRLRYLDGLIVAAEHNRLPLRLCPQLEDTDFNHASLYATLRSAEPPQIPVAAEYSVEARTATPEEEQLLKMTTVIPLLVATQLAHNQDGRPLELTVAAYRGDRYRFRATIANR